MEFDWTTVALEVLNFLVLIWLMKRFFYRPVLAVIEKRRADSEKIIADADAKQRAAEALKDEYALRLAEAGKERERLLAKLDEEIAATRVRRLAEVDAEVTADRQRRQKLEEREKREQATALEREAVAIAARFASHFLDRLAGPELEARLIDLVLADLGAGEPEKLSELSAALRDSAVRIQVFTAYPLDRHRCTALSAVLGKLAGRELVPEFGEDATLKAGLCLMAGAWVLMANLRDELLFFGGAKRG